MKREKLVELRESMGWSDTQVAERIGVDQTTYSRIERGETKNPGFETMWRLARLYGVTLDSFADDTPGPAFAGERLLREAVDQTTERVSSRLQAFMADAGMVRLLDALNLVPPEQHEDLRRCIASAIRRERESQGS